MTVEEALDALVAALRGTAPDHRAADFSATYRVVRDWFRVPTEDRTDELFQLAIGPCPGVPRLCYLYVSRCLRHPADGSSIQVHVNLTGECWVAGAQGWTFRRWLGPECARPEEVFAALEATTEFGLAARAHPWHVRVSWNRCGGPVDPARVGDDLGRAPLR